MFFLFRKRMSPTQNGPHFLNLLGKINEIVIKETKSLLLKFTVTYWMKQK